MVIINRSMPRTCSECFCYDVEYSVCQASEHNNLTSEDMIHKPCWCPLTEIVQCKDCRYWDRVTETSIPGVSHVGTCNRHMKGLTPGHGYCKWATRRTD